MARARNIKPGLFRNEILGVADPLCTLLFEGLWLLADRDGKLEDRPMRIKGDIFPYRDGIDVNSMLAWLESQGFIQRYKSGGKSLILVVEFRKHQNPHKNEPESEYGDPEVLGKTSEFIGSTPADSLIPDSLIPDSLIPESETHAGSNPEVEKIDVAETLVVPDAGIPASRVPRSATAHRLSEEWAPSRADREFCQQERPDLNVEAVAALFRDYWRGVGGKEGRKSDWHATWRNWVRRERRASPPARASPGYQTPVDKQKAWMDELMGGKNGQCDNIIDINPAPGFLGHEAYSSDANALRKKIP